MLNEMRNKIEKASLIGLFFVWIDGYDSRHAGT